MYLLMKCFAGSTACFFAVALFCLQASCINVIVPWWSCSLSGAVPCAVDAISINAETILANLATNLLGLIVKLKQQIFR